MLILETFAVAARARLIAAGLCGGNVELHRDPPTLNSVLPLASVTYGSNKGTADGDPRTGTSDFVHTLPLAIDVLDTAATGAALMAKLAQHSETIMSALLRDLGWGIFDNGRSGLEGVDGVRQVIEKGIEGERTVYHLQVQIDLLYRSQWEPSTDGLPDFTTFGVDTGVGDGTTTIGAEIDVT